MADVYDKIDKRFVFILEAVHGSERRVRTRENRMGQYYEYQVHRGHKLRILFPMLRFEPPYETIKQTVTHILLEIEVRKFREHFKSIAHELDPLEFDGMHRQLEALETIRATSEAELDQEYQALAGRRGMLAA
jgi:hypothetical protein